MKQLVILGTGSFARLVYYYLKEFGEKNIVAFSIDGEHIGKQSPVFLNLPVVPFETLAQDYPPDEYDVVLGIGYSKMNQLRKRFFLEAKRQGFHVEGFQHPSAIVSRDAIIGEGNLIMENVVVQPFCQIGDANLLWFNASVAHDDVVGSFNLFSAGAGLAGFVKVGNCCFLGRNSFITDHVTVADSTLVGAGAYLKKDSNPYDVIVPAYSVTLEGRVSTEFI